jgi:hypothetical protein
MSSTYVNALKNVPQTEPIPGKNQIKNNAGGYVYQADDFDRLDRFLILGSDENTYYVGKAPLTRDNATVVLRCIAQDGIRTVNRIVEISVSGRAPKNDPAIFALALAAKNGDDATRSLAYKSVSKVCRTGTFLFQFANAINELGGWGRGARNSIASWYTDKDANSLAYQLVKYRQRDGWSHRDLLRLSHPKATDDVKLVLATLFSASVKKITGTGIALDGDGSQLLRPDNCLSYEKQAPRIAMCCGAGGCTHGKTQDELYESGFNGSTCYHAMRFGRDKCQSRDRAK